MIKRPKGTDTEQDIFQMQKEFLMEKKKGSNFQPAAKVVKLSKPSKFAQTRATAKQPATKEATAESTSESVGDVPKPMQYILGDIIERHSTTVVSAGADVEMDEGTDAFPSVERVNDAVKAEQSDTLLSLFALSQLKKANKSVPMNDAPLTDEATFGQSSCILRNDENNAIHKENVEFLKQQSEDDILEEQQRLLASMDPSIINFLRQKRKAALDEIPEMDAVSAAEAAASETTTSSLPASVSNAFPDLDIFQHEDLKKWLHMDVVEPEKLEWMRDLPADLPDLKPGELYEARFDWKGVLLPFSLEPEDNTSTDLYLHGDDAQRPGYTLQELFRLARSTVIQQRLAAINAISGILSIYNQGYYDHILDVPISKIFFLLRFALDDNTPAMLEAASKALSILFYNQTDEILLDLTFDSSTDLIEPTLEIGSKDTNYVSVENLNKKFTQMNLSNKILQTDIDTHIHEENELASMHDFYWAETNLIKCLLRTDMLQRISYILATLDFETSTAANCIKILIRIARTDGQSVSNILSHKELMRNMFRLLGHTPIGSEARMLNAAQILIFKFCRIIISHGEQYVEKLRKYGIEDALKNFIYLQENSITAQSVKVQIEANRCAKVYICTTKNNDFYNDLVPALQYSLEWIYQFLTFENAEQFVFRQCASALVSLIGVNTSAGQIFPKLSLCFSKWFSAASKVAVDELSQIVLLATCVNTMAESMGNCSELFDTHFKAFLDSAFYKCLGESLPKTSSLLSKNQLRSHSHDALPHLDSVTISSRNLPSLIISEKSALMLFNSLARLSNAKHLKDNQAAFTTLWFNDSLRAYIELLATKINQQFATKWFVRSEIQFVVAMLKSTAVRNVAGDKHMLLNLTYKIITCIGDHQLDDLLFLLNNIVFNIDFYSHKCIFRQTSVNNWNATYVKIIMQKYFIRMNSEDRKPLHNFNRETVLASDWPCVMVQDMYEMSNAGRAFAMPEQDVIRTTFSLLSLINANNIDILTPTQQLIYTMKSFFGKDGTFHDEEINSLLATFVRTSLKRSCNFNLDDRFGVNINFESLYIAFLDQFQGTSYGNKTFGVLVLAPLAQRYNIKWRQMVWSEHVDCLVFVKCAEADLIGGLEDYLEPLETDRTLLKCYYQAINSNRLVPGSIPHRIATHHVDAYRAKMGKTQ